jgi:poly-gamma-glutamate synthesis protein (capsule biosynthesis protein)
MMKERETSFLLILAAAFLMLLIYATSPSLMKDRESTFVDFSPEVEIIATGDVMLGRTVMIKSLDEGKPSYPFDRVKDTLSEADIVFTNLENPFYEGCPRQTEGLKFCASPEMVEGLLDAGVDVVTLANNHARNYGEEGIEQTKNILEENGISYVGFGNLVVREEKGYKFGFLGFDFLTNKPDEVDFDLIRQSDKKVDVLIAELQRQWAKRMAEEGIDVVVGHGPHWVQEREELYEKPVYYSLGNFVFDQMWSEKTKEGLAVKFTFRNGELTKEEKLPAYISSWAQPEFIGQ